MRDDNRPVRRSPRSLLREPRVPPQRFLDKVDGRVLHPSTALTVKGIVPRPTVYVGPRLLVSRGPRDEEAVNALGDLAGRFGWQVVVKTRAQRSDP